MWAMNASTSPRPASDKPAALHERAADDLRYIRQAMERATSFTGVSGKGYVAVGVTALAATWVAARQATPEAWLLVWLVELPVAAALAVGFAVRKARSQGASLLSHTGRQLLFAFTPPMVVGALVSGALYLEGRIDLLPGVWLALYGAGVMTGGAYSVRVIPIMGAGFIALGAGVLLASLPGDLALALGFGGLHLVFGVLVWRRYGG